MLEHKHLDWTIQRLKQRYAAVKRWSVGGDVILAMTLVAFVVTLVEALSPWSVALLAVYGVIVALGLLAFVVLTWRLHWSTLQTLTKADQVLQSHERLSTAYEYQQQYSEHPFLVALVAEAEKIAPRVEPYLVLPLHLPRRLLGIPVLLLATAGLWLFEVTPVTFDTLTENDADQTAAKEGKRLEQWGRELEELAKQEQLDRSLILARHMRNLGQRLQNGGEAKTQSVERIATLSDYLQRLRQELRERALLSDVGMTTVHEMLASGKSLKQELQDILQLLQDDSLPREMMAVAEQGLEQLRRQVGPNQALEQLLQNLRAGDLAAARQLLRDVIQQQQAAEEMEHLGRAQRALEYSSRALQREGSEGGSGRSAEGPSENTRAGSGTDFETEMLSEDMPGMEEFSAPGSDAGYGVSSRTPLPSDQILRESEAPVSNVDVKSIAGPMRLSYIRYLPMHNASQVPVEEAVVQYQHAAEEVLTHERIPRDYREQIKQYFLSLGIMQ